MLLRHVYLSLCLFLLLLFFLFPYYYLSRLNHCACRGGGFDHDNLHSFGVLFLFLFSMEKGGRLLGSLSTGVCVGCLTEGGGGVGLSGCRKGGDALERYHPEETRSQGGRLSTKLWEQETRGGGYSKK